MSLTGSPFCEHKKLRTSCAACKAGAIPPPTLAATPFVTSEEREKKEAKRAARESRPATASGEEAPAEERKVRPTGPGKPLMPTRAKKRGVSADEAAAATAWWVKK